ncbi:MAG: HEAT repeat domain-containing protein [Phycisphaerales bacterium]
MSRTRSGIETTKRLGFAAVGILLLAGTLCWGTSGFPDIAPQIVKAPLSEKDWSEARGRLIQQISMMGSAAIDPILPLLKHQDEAVRRRATEILRYVDGLGDEHLDALIESKRSGNEEIALVIARIGTPKAIAFLVDELKKEKRADTPTYWAFYVLDTMAGPPLVDLIESGPLDDELAATVVSIFGELKGKAGGSVDRLTKLVVAGRDRKTVECAALALGAIGERARSSVPILRKLAEDDPAYRGIVDRSLQAMNKPEAVADTLRCLGACPGVVPATSELARWKEQGETLVDPLIEFISLRQGNETATGWAVYLLGEIGPTARKAVPGLLKLAEEKPGSYQYEVDTALLEMGAPEAASGVLRLLKNRSSPYAGSFVIHRIVSLKELGRPAYPALIQCLKGDDWELRLETARAIAEVEYIEGTPALIELLGEKDDWRQVFVAAKALGRLRAARAVGPLTELSKSHWYAPVREAGKEAILVIQGQAAYSDSREDRLREIGLEDYMLVKAPSVTLDAGQPLAMEPDRLDAAELAKLAYKEEQQGIDGDAQGRIVLKRYVVDRVPEGDV